MNADDLALLRTGLIRLKAALDGFRRLAEIPPQADVFEVFAVLTRLERDLGALTEDVAYRESVSWGSRHPANPRPPRHSPNRYLKPLESTDIEPIIRVPRHDMNGRLLPDQVPERTGRWRRRP